MLEDFDFRAWARLARTDPVAFEDARRELIEKAIVRGNDPQRMRRMQWRVDAERLRARTPMKACLRISAMMWDAFFELRTALNRAAGLSGEPVRQLALVAPSGKKADCIGRGPGALWQKR